MGIQTISPEVLATAPSDAIERTAALRDRAREFATASRSDATLAAYASDLRHFWAWTEANDLAGLPATPETVALYLTSMADDFKASTISRRVAAISVAHQHAGLPSPTMDARVRSVLTGIRRTNGTAPRQVAPATIGEIRKMTARMGESTIELRDRAILLLGFAGAFRRSELVSLDLSDLRDQPDGILVMLRRSKIDQEGLGETKAIPLGSDAETCPVRALRRWIAVAGISDGPIFRPVDRHASVAPTRLSGKAVSHIVKRAASRAGLDSSVYAGHSLRAGFVTTAAANGASERAIARQTGHAPGSTVLRTYIRHASAFTDNAVSTLGL
jgi:site-specific recombinase XerD